MATNLQVAILILWVLVLQEK